MALRQFRLSCHCRQHSIEAAKSRRAAKIAASHGIKRHKRGGCTEHGRRRNGGVLLAELEREEPDPLLIADNIRN